MAAIQVKNVPMDLHEAIRRRASDQRMTIGGYILRLARARGSDRRLVAGNGYPKKASARA